MGRGKDGLAPPGEGVVARHRHASAAPCVSRAGSEPPLPRADGAQGWHCPGGELGKAFADPGCALHMAWLADLQSRPGRYPPPPPPQERSVSLRIGLQIQIRPPQHRFSDAPPSPGGRCPAPPKLKARPQLSRLCASSLFVVPHVCLFGCPHVFRTTAEYCGFCLVSAQAISSPAIGYMLSVTVKGAYD